jgi:hypothetical protein
MKSTAGERRRASGALRTRPLATQLPHVASHADRTPVLSRAHTRSALARREASPELQAAPAEDEEEEEDESEWETDTDDDDAPGRKMVKPMFVPKARGAPAPLRLATRLVRVSANPKPNAHPQARSMRCEGAACRADARARLSVWRLRVQAGMALRPRAPKLAPATTDSLSCFRCAVCASAFPCPRRSARAWRSATPRCWPPRKRRAAPPASLPHTCTPCQARTPSHSTRRALISSLSLCRITGGAGG